MVRESRNAKAGETKKGLHARYTHAARIATVPDGVIRTTWMCVCRKPTDVARMAVCVKALGETDGLFLRTRASGRGGFHHLLMAQPRTKRARKRPPQKLAPTEV